MSVRTAEPLTCIHGLPFWHACSECGAIGLKPSPLREALEKIATGWQMDALEMQTLARKALTENPL